MTNVRDVKVIEATVEAWSPWIAKTERPDLVGSSDSRKRVVAGYGVVARRIVWERVTMHIEAEDLAQQTVDVLAVMKWIPAASAIAKRHIEIAIRTKTEPSTFVIRNTVGLVDSDDLMPTRRVSLIGITS